MEKLSKYEIVIAVFVTIVVATMLIGAVSDLIRALNYTPIYANGSINDVPVSCVWVEEEYWRCEE